MTKYRFLVTGISSTGRLFSSYCIEDDIIKVIERYRKAGYSPRSVTQAEQVSKDTPVGVESIGNESLKDLKNRLTKEYYELEDTITMMFKTCFKIEDSLNINRLMYNQDLISTQLHNLRILNEDIFKEN